MKSTNNINDYYKSIMPYSRSADYCLGFYDSSIFIDFDVVNNSDLAVRRISFDGYGCCKLDQSDVNLLSGPDSIELINILKNDDLDQVKVHEVVLKMINVNRELIWTEALEKYGLIRNQ